MGNCIFCKIINKEIPSTILYEDDKVIAFKDISPEAPVHVLIVPKKHIQTILDVEAEDAGYLIEIHIAAVKIAKELGIDKNGFRLINNCGSDGGQSVLHLHYHLIGGRKLGTKIL